MIKFILQNWNKIRKIPLYNTDLSNNLQHPISFHCWKSENRSIVYVTDLHASITSCGCTDKILHFEPLLKCYELAHHSGPATTDRWRQWIRLFLTPDAEEGGREGGSEGDARDRWHPRRPLSPRLIHPCCWPREWKGRKEIECTHAPRRHADSNEGEGGRNAWSVRDSVRFIAINDTGGTVERNMFHVAIKWSG